MSKIYTQFLPLHHLTPMCFPSVFQIHDFFFNHFCCLHTSTQAYTTVVHVYFLSSCGGLNWHVSHRLMCLRYWPSVSGPVRRHGLVGIVVALMEKMYYYGGGPWGFIYAQVMPSRAQRLLLLPVDQHVELSAPSPSAWLYTLPCWASWC